MRYGCGTPTLRWPRWAEMRKRGQPELVHEASARVYAFVKASARFVKASARVWFGRAARVGLGRAARIIFSISSLKPTSSIWSASSRIYTPHRYALSGARPPG
jgi:hypothetical protein